MVVKTENIYCFMDLKISAARYFSSNMQHNVKNLSDIPLRQVTQGSQTVPNQEVPPYHLWLLSDWHFPFPDPGGFGVRVSSLKTPLAPLLVLLLVISTRSAEYAII